MYVEGAVNRNKDEIYIELFDIICVSIDLLGH